MLDSACLTKLMGSERAASAAAGRRRLSWQHFFPGLPGPGLLPQIFDIIAKRSEAMVEASLGGIAEYLLTAQIDTGELLKALQVTGRLQPIGTACPSKWVIGSI